jgi:hypothetical protein
VFFAWSSFDVVTTSERILMRKSDRRYLLLLPVLVALILTVSACGGSDSSSTLTIPTVTPTLVTETFTGSIGQNGSAVHPFAVKVSGYTLLAGYTAITPSSLTSLGVGIGYWDGTTSTCGLNQVQIDAAKAGSTAISVSASSANYCLRAYDGGNIPAGVTASYTLSVQHY